MSRRKPPSPTQPPGRSTEEARERLKKLAKTLEALGAKGAAPAVAPLDFVAMAREHGDTFLGLVEHARKIASGSPDAGGKVDPASVLVVLDELVSRATDRGILLDPKTARMAERFGLKQDEPEPTN